MFASFGVGQVLWSLLWLTLVFMWMVLFLRIVADVFRSDDLSGWAKAGWLLGCLIAPFLGVLAYLIVRGDKMTERDLAMLKAQDEAARAYIQSAAGAESPMISSGSQRCATRVCCPTKSSLS